MTPTDPTFRLPGLRLVDHTFTLPLDHDAAGGATIDILPPKAHAGGGGLRGFAALDALGDECSVDATHVCL